MIARLALILLSFLSVNQLYADDTRGLDSTAFSQLGHPIDSKEEFLRVIEQIRTDPRGADSEYRSDNGIWYMHLTESVNLDGGEVVIRDIDNVTIIGNGHQFYRTRNQKTSRMFHIIDVRGLTFENIGFDDNANGQFNVPGSNVNMIWVRNSFDVTFNRTYVANSTGYTLYVQKTFGFKFTNSILRNGGVLGLYVGHGSANASGRVTVDNNHFIDTATNAVAFLGVDGTVQNTITNNLFENNHRAGRWPVAARYGSGLTGGGQLYIAEADNVLVQGNIIRDGECSNCYSHNSSKAVKDVTGIELSGLYGSEVRVSRLIITDNVITRNDAYGIGQNANSTLDDTTRIFDNLVFDNGRDFKVQDIPSAN